MSHRTGTLQDVSPVIQIGPDTGDPASSGNTWAHDFAHTPAPTGSKFLILHFQNVDLPPGNRLEVDLGYGTDEFTAADGAQFWTRPINIYALAGGLVPIRYIADGAASGSVELDRYGRGERLSGEQDPTSLSNCDPFQEQPVYQEPIYDPFWYCDEPPNWENVACVAPPDVRALVARSVGMIVTVHEADGIVSSCSVTLVDDDKVILAGHCVNNETEALTSSVSFDYQTSCAGNRPAGYDARFYKVVELLERRWTSEHDYALLRLRESPEGVTPVQMRHDVPSPGEQVFGIHHPNGAVKKLSIPHPGFSTVSFSSAHQIRVPEEFDISGGSSGSGLFDVAGRICGVLSNGNPCGHPPAPTVDVTYYPTAAFFLDMAPAPPAPITREVMIVFDRSGSMSQDDGAGRSKIAAARDAASLFVQLARSSVGNMLGLVSFSSTASSPADFGLVGVTSGNKNTLIGAAPYAGGIVGGLSPGGHTSIGAGLAAARAELMGSGVSPQAILLMTDGRQNREPTIEAVEDSLGDIALHAIGFGTESNLEGPLLTELAAAHSGLYMRAGNGLALEKFFTEAFGNIFEAGVLFDPERMLPANEGGRPLEFPVCGETLLTVVAGWDRSDTQLLVELTTPAGAVVTAATEGVEAATGRSWTFLRVALPHAGERDGLWQARVLRPTGSSTIPQRTPELRYFLDVIPTGGPRLLLAEAPPRRRRYYTGDRFEPRVMLRYDDGSWPHHAQVRLTVSRPSRGTGDILTEAGLGHHGPAGDDAASPRLAALQALEAADGALVGYVDTTLSLGDTPADTGEFERGGMFAGTLADALEVEGNYTMHAVATYGQECQGRRELRWSLCVTIGIDAGRTTVSSAPAGIDADGRDCLRLRVTPRDRYGHHLGPGRADGFSFRPQPGTTIEPGVVDHGDGSYGVVVCWDPDAGPPPRIGLAQPGRPDVVVPVPGAPSYVYSVRFACGGQDRGCCACAPLRPGRYATEISVHNPHDREVSIRKRFIPLALAGSVLGREPHTAVASARDIVRLPPHGATLDDCCRILERVLGARPQGAVPLTSGVIEIVSPVELSVSALHTVSGEDGGTPSVCCERVPPVLRPR